MHTQGETKHHLTQQSTLHLLLKLRTRDHDVSNADPQAPTGAESKTSEWNTQQLRKSNKPDAEATPGALHEYFEVALDEDFPGVGALLAKFIHRLVTTFAVAYEVDASRIELKSIAINQAAGVRKIVAAVFCVLHDSYCIPGASR